MCALVRQIIPSAPAQPVCEPAPAPNPSLFHDMIKSNEDGGSPVLTIEQIKKTVTHVAHDFNAASTDEKIQKISLFGSYASQQATEESDVDLLVEFNSAFVSFISFGRLLSQLENALKVPIDVVPSPLPSNSIVLIEATVPLYVAD